MLSIHGAVVCLIASLQFVPLAFKVELSGSSYERALQSTEVKITAGFCLGFLLLIPIDVLFDVANRHYKLIASRVFLFLVSSAYSIIIFIPDRYELKLGVYACYIGFAAVSIFGRLLMDLHIYDTTNTWTFCRSIFLTLLIGTITSLAEADYVLNTTQAYPLLMLVCVLILSFIALCALCMWRLYLGRPSQIVNPMSPTIREIWRRLSHDECFLLLLMTTASIYIIFLGILPRLFKQPYRGIRDRHKDMVVLDQIIRVIFATTVALCPSLALKFKAKALQNDLDLKKVFVRYVSHEIRLVLTLLPHP
jgi:hypothetical protein